MKPSKQLLKEIEAFKNEPTLHQLALKTFITEFNPKNRMIAVDFKNFDKDSQYIITTKEKEKEIKCIFWKGILIDRKKYDFQLNIAINPIHLDTHFLEIYVHKKGKPLHSLDAWVKEDGFYFDDFHLEIKRSLECFS
jgi:hypothetical protein